MTGPPCPNEKLRLGPDRVSFPPAKPQRLARAVGTFAWVGGAAMRLGGAGREAAGHGEGEKSDREHLAHGKPPIPTLRNVYDTGGDIGSIRQPPSSGSSEASPRMTPALGICALLPIACGFSTRRSRRWSGSQTRFRCHASEVLAPSFPSASTVVMRQWCRPYSLREPSIRVPLCHSVDAVAPPRVKPFCTTTAIVRAP